MSWEPKFPKKVSVKMFCDEVVYDEELSADYEVQYSIQTENDTRKIDDYFHVTIY